MSYIKLQNENFDTFSLTLRPRYEFSSSSLSGVTGSIPLIERPSYVNKDVVQRRTIMGVETVFDSTGEEIKQTIDAIESLSSQSDTTSNNKRSRYLDFYVGQIRNRSEARKNNIVIPIQRLTQSVDFTTSSMMKRLIVNNLMPSYRSSYTDANFSYKNYHSINFFTSSTVPSDSAIIYPNRVKKKDTDLVADTIRFNITNAFSADFYINPRYTSEAGAAYHAGTILHLSSSFCLSLLTGSHRDQNNQPDTFRLAIGFKQSANVPPNLIDTNIPNGSRTGEQQNLFVSDDNLLKRNNWHHVTVNWGYSSTSMTGSFIVDNVTSSFIYPSGSVRLTSTEDDVLIMGNFCLMPAGENTKKFFNASVASDEGLVRINGSGFNDPTGFTFQNPLNAELHDIKLFNRSISNSAIEKFKKVGANNSVKNLVFYVPVLFTNQFSLTQQDFLTPVLKDSSTSFVPVTPFNVNLAHATQVFSPNLQNFLFDLSSFSVAGLAQRARQVEYTVQPSAPRLYKLTGSKNATTVDKFAIDHMMRDANFTKRMLTLLPCDNGLFVPDYSIVGENQSGDYSPYRDDIGNADKTSISLQNTDVNTNVQTSLGEKTVDIKESQRGNSGQTILVKKFPRPDFYSSTNLEVIAENLGNITTLLSFSGSISDRTRGFTSTRIADNSSNLVNMYTFSNLYYGNQIFPSSLSLSTTNLTGSGGKINITLKDNGAGGLYRDDCETPAATWATVGNIFYDQGLAIIKSPNLYYFGKDNFTTTFNGSQNIHTYTLEAICPAGEINSSSNPSYLSFPPTNEQNETADNFVYITGINIHDDNFNVIMRANLAQPVLKRPDEEILFRLKQDF